MLLTASQSRSMSLVKFFSDILLFLSVNTQIFVVKIRDFYLDIQDPRTIYNNSSDLFVPIHAWTSFLFRIDKRKLNIARELGALRLTTPDADATYIQLALSIARDRSRCTNLMTFSSILGILQKLFVMCVRRSCTICFGNYVKR